MNITGTIKLIEELQTFDSGFTKQVLVLTTSEKYPQDVALEFYKEACAKLDKFNVGDTVTVEYNVRGSEWKGKYYVNLNGWKVESAQADDVVSPVLDPEDTSLPF